ncbi:MAG: hypothetical protein ABJF23_12445 [Bryobacteraceae bacterium]
MKRRTFLALAASGAIAYPRTSQLQAATFQVDATPDLGDPLCFGLCEPASRVDDRLTARGIILLNAGAPIVLCAVDWVEIASLGYDQICADLAKAANTSVDRVSLHTLHQHDTPGYNPGAEEILAANGLGGKLYGAPFISTFRQRLSAAVLQAARKGQPVTHLGIGRGKIEKVASNRRILGPDGKVKYGRMSSCRVPEAIAAPEGTIDPYVTLLSLWHEEKPIVSITYYATHPQSYYCKGGVSADFIGAARALREAALPGVAHIHFNGAGGNVAAGKYNDGSPANRAVLAGRVAEGFKRAWDATEKSPLTAEQVRWSVVPVHLPTHPRLQEAKLLAELRDTRLPEKQRTRAARDLSWLRLPANRQTPLQLLDFGKACVLHMPGELFVEYQLAAQSMRPDATVAMAAYGDCGPGYIGTRVAYGQGGYETGEVSMVAPEVEDVLMNGMRRLLRKS